MKLFLCLAAFIALAQANIDWSKVKRFDITPKLPFMPIKSDGKIVGGVEAQENSIPYQAALLIDTPKGSFFCGGSLISTKYILTAAHCVDSATQAQVILGAHKFQDTEANQVRVTANKFQVHSGWDSTRLVNDIALIELDAPVTLSDAIQLVQLPSQSDELESYAGAIARISGWGLDHDGATAVSPILRQVSVEVMTNFVCNIQYLGAIQHSHVCTSGEEGRGSCSGDSGGPLVIDNKQIGIVSFGLSLGCEIGWPSVFTRTTSYLDWIAAHSDVTISP